MSKALILIACSLALSGCSIDKLKNPHEPTPAQQAMIDSGLFGAPAVMSEVSLEPECSMEFRIRRCDPVTNAILPW